MFARFILFNNWFLVCFRLTLSFPHFYLPVSLIVNKMWRRLIPKLATVSEAMINEINDSWKRYLAMPTVKRHPFDNFVLYQHKPIPPYFGRKFLWFFHFSNLWVWVVFIARQLIFVLNARQHYLGHSWKEMSASF